MNGSGVWIVAKYAQTCSCGKVMAKGARIVWFPLSRTACCGHCAKSESPAYKAGEDAERLQARA